MKEATIPPPTTVLLLASDLNVRARLEGALGPDADIRVFPREHPLDEASRAQDVAVVDLDEHGADAVVELKTAGFEGRIVGFFSHVNRDLGTAATAAGADVFPRGSFWANLVEILSPT